VANKGAQLPNFRPMSGVAGWIKMPLGAGDIVLDGDPIPPKGAQLWPNGCLDQDATWYEGRPLPRPHFVTWGPSSPSPKKGHSSLLIFSPHLLWPNGWMDQDDTWYRDTPRLWLYTVLDGDPLKGHSPQFSAHVCCGQTAGWIKMQLGTEVGPADIVLDGDPALPKRGKASPLFGPCLLWRNGRPSQLLLSFCLKCVCCGLKC